MPVSKKRKVKKTKQRAQKPQKTVVSILNVNTPTTKFLEFLIETKWPMEAQRQGRCLRTAAWALLAMRHVPDMRRFNFSGAKAVIGEIDIQHPAPVHRGPHAWVEFSEGGKSICFDGVQNFAATKSDFYKLFGVTDTRDFPEEELIIYVDAPDEAYQS